MAPVVCCVRWPAWPRRRHVALRREFQAIQPQANTACTLGSANQWFPGRVTAVHSDDTYDIKYDDGDEDERLSARYLSTNVDRFDDE